MAIDTIGDLEPGTPTDNTSAGGGNEQLQEIKTAIQGSFPNFKAPAGEDVCLATGPEIDSGLAAANTAVQEFGAPAQGTAAATQRAASGSPLAIVPADNDYTINNINDTVNDPDFRVAQFNRAFLKQTDRTFLDTFYTYLGGDELVDIQTLMQAGDSIGRLGDVDTSALNDGDLLQWDDLAGEWVTVSTSVLVPAGSICENYYAEDNAWNADGGELFLPSPTTEINNITAATGLVENPKPGLGWRFTATEKVKVDITAEFDDADNSGYIFEWGLTWTQFLEAVTHNLGTYRAATTTIQPEFMDPITATVILEPDDFISIPLIQNTNANPGLSRIQMTVLRIA